MTGQEERTERLARHFIAEAARRKRAERTRAAWESFLATPDAVDTLRAAIERAGRRPRRRWWDPRTWKR